MSAPQLIIGIPSKGRLQENAFGFFARAGLSIVQPRGARDYRASVKELPGIEIALLSAAEIVGELARGAVHLGITGQDLIEENLPDPAARVALLTPLGFGQANVVVAVPEAWIDVHDMADIEEVSAEFRAKKGRRLRVATKYINLTRRYFKQNGVSDYRIVESLGATEGAPAAGTADIIVDITTSGATLAANALKILNDGTMLKSEANLVAALHARWDDAAREAARQVLFRIQAEEEARTRRELRCILPGAAEALLLPELEARGVDVLSSTGAGLTLLVKKAEVAVIADALVAAGARRVLVNATDYVFTRENPLFDKLGTRISPPETPVKLQII